jgi:hypothetical protein
MVVREGKTPVISGVFRLSPDNQTDNRLDNRPATGADFLLLPPRGKFKLLHFLRCQLPKILTSVVGLDALPALLPPIGAAEVAGVGGCCS